MWWKPILRLIILPVAGAIYVAITGSLGDIPLDKAAFMDLVYWLVGLAVGGWGLTSAKLATFLSKDYK